MILIIDSSVIGCGLMLVVEIKHGVVHLLSLMPLRIDMVNSILSLTILIRIVALRNKLCMVLRVIIVIIVILINVVIGILIIIGCGLVISILVLIVHFLSEIA